MIEFSNVTKTYKAGNKAIRKLNIQIADGEFVFIVGRSGSGKSTLLKMLLKEVEPTSGHIIVNGVNLQRMPRRHVPKYRRRLGMVFQDFKLLKDRTVYENVAFAQRVIGVPVRRIRENVPEMLKLVGLSSKYKFYPNQLSGGEQQRVAIARALVTKPSIVLLDEPLCNLDVQLRIEMRTEMSYLFHKLKTTVFHVTHDPSEAFAMADRIIVMNGGKIDQADDPKTCYLKPRTALVAGLLGAGNDLKDISILETGENGACRIQVGEEQVEGTYFPAQEKAGGDIVSASEEKARPGQLRFRPEDGRWTGGQASGNCFKARAVLSSFEGGCYRVKMVTGNGQEFCIIHQEPIPEQTEGYVQVEKEKLYVYELAVD